MGSALQSYEQKIIVCSTRIQIELNKIYQSAHIANTHWSYCALFDIPENCQNQMSKNTIFFTVIYFCSALVDAMFAIRK